MAVQASSPVARLCCQAAAVQQQHSCLPALPCPTYPHDVACGHAALPRQAAHAQLCILVRESLLKLQEGQGQTHPWTALARIDHAQLRSYKAAQVC